MDTVETKLSPRSRAKANGNLEMHMTKTGHHPRIKSEGGLFRDHALLKIPRLTALRCAPVRRLRVAEAAAERPREEVAAIVLITALIVATLVVAWRHRGGATTRAFPKFDRTFNDLAVLAVQNCDQHLVATIHVSAEFQTAFIVDECCLIGQMHRQIVRMRSCV